MKIIDGFKPFKPKKTTMPCGKLYVATVEIPVNEEKRRTVRVYLPPEYDGKRRFKVLYMTDGQNMVDRHTSAYGDWEIAHRMRELVKEGYEPFMLVGVDCPVVPSHRTREYIFNKAKPRPYVFPKNNENWNPYGDKFASFIVNELKPYIDENFMTLPDKENTGFGGSSMGGLFTFDIVSQYPDVFSFGLVFSPAICIFTENSYFKDMESRHIKVNDQKFFIYSGGLDKLENHILKSSTTLYTKLKSKGFDNDHLQLLTDSRLPHNEASWTKNFNEGLKMWLSK